MTSIANTQNLITLNTNDILNLIGQYRTLFDSLDDEYVKRKYLGAVVNSVATPLLPYFRRLIPKLVKGNLKRSAGKKIVRYSSTAIAYIGYQMTHGEDPDQKGWAQSFVERGTARRYTKGSIASSYKKRGAFETTYMQNGEYDLSPPYPVSFLKRASPGQRVELARSPEGGRAGVKPLHQTWQANKRQVAVKMLSQTRKALLKAYAEQERRINRKI